MLLSFSTGSNAFPCPAPKTTHAAMVLPMSPESDREAIMSFSGDDLHTVQNKASAIGTNSAIVFPRTCVLVDISSPVSPVSPTSLSPTKESLYITATHTAHVPDAIHVCFGTCSFRKTFDAAAANNGPVARMANTEATYVRFAATMNAMF